MSKSVIDVFLCTGKDCARAWERVADAAPGKWLKRQVKDAGLPYKLNVIPTECMDRCDSAGCVCFVHHGRAALETGVRSRHDVDRLLAALRACVEQADAGLGRAPCPGGVQEHFHNGE